MAEKKKRKKFPNIQRQRNIFYIPSKIIEKIRYLKTKSKNIRHENNITKHSKNEMKAEKITRCSQTTKKRTSDIELSQNIAEIK